MNTQVETQPQDSQPSEQPLDIFSLSDEQILAMESDVSASMDGQHPLDHQLDESSTHTGSAPKAQSSEEDILKEILGEGNEPAEQEEQKPAEPQEPEESKKPEESQEKVQEPSETPNYEEFFKKVTAPFKAAGREIKIESPEELIRLAQMGVGYSRKMEKMNENAALVRSLKEAGLDDNDKINFAIDLMKGKKEAIAKLVKTHNIDTVDFDIDNSDNYQPENHIISGKSEELRGHIEDIQSRENGTVFLEDFGQSFDAESRRVILEQPQLLADLADNYQAGNYQKIMGEVQRLQLVRDPSIVGMSTLEAYVAVGQRMFTASANGHVPNGQPQSSQPKVQEPAPIAVKQAAQVIDPVAERRKQAAPAMTTKSTGTTAEVLNGIDLSKLTDEQIIAMEDKLFSDFN